MKRCLVTGVAGGLGHHLAHKLLSEGHDVTGIDDFSVGRNTPPCYIQRLDIVHDYIPKVNYDWIFHLAAKADIVPSITCPGIYHDVNVTGTLKILEYARQVNCKRFIYAASSSCYGIPNKYPTPESAKIKPEYPYALTKYLGEQYVLHYNKVYGLPTVSLRLFNVYGPGFRTSGTYGAVFGVFLAQLANGKPLTVVGDGSQRRDFTYVSDVVSALIKAAESDVTGEKLNVGSGNAYSINQLVALLGSPERVTLPKRPGEPDITYADIKKIQEYLGWKPRVSFEDGVAKMLKHLKDYKDAPLWDEASINKATESWFKCLKS